MVLNLIDNISRSASCCILFDLSIFMKCWSKISIALSLVCLDHYILWPLPFVSTFTKLLNFFLIGNKNIIKTNWKTDESQYKVFMMVNTRKSNKQTNNNKEQEKNLKCNTKRRNKLEDSGAIREAPTPRPIK